MTQQGRLKISQAQKARWARVNGHTGPVNVSPGTRTGPITRGQFSRLGTRGNNPEEELVLMANVINSYEKLQPAAKEYVITCLSGT